MKGNRNMIKTILSILLIGILLIFGSCTKEKTNITDYQYMYDEMVDVFCQRFRKFCDLK